MEDYPQAFKSNSLRLVLGPHPCGLGRFFAQRLWSKQRGSRTASASDGLLGRENRSSQ